MPLGPLVNYYLHEEKLVLQLIYPNFQLIIWKSDSPVGRKANHPHTDK